MTLEEQRALLTATIKSVYANGVHDLPSDGKVSPPCVIIGQPTITFPVNSSLGSVNWPITLFESRTDKGAAQLRLEAQLQAILFELRKGAGFGLVLQGAQPVPDDLSGLPMPTYLINATSVLPNC
jgi:hypothetical protein